MANQDFVYISRIKADVSDVKKQIKLVRDDLAKSGFKLKIPNLDSGNAQKALDSLRIGNDKLQAVTVKTQTMLTAEGKRIEQIVGLNAKYSNSKDYIVNANKKVESSFSGLSKDIALYDQMGKYAQDSANKAQNMGAAHKNAIQGTASSLIDAIYKWQKLADVGQGNSKQALKLKADIESLNTTLRAQNGAATTAANSMQKWSVRISNAIKQTFAYTLAMRGIRVAQQEVGKAIQYVIDLNTEMTKIQILQTEGAQTASQINVLADSYNRLAKEMGVSTLEVARGSVEWLRQGKTIEETGQLLKATMMMSKLGNMSAAVATEHLTSTINGYGMAASEATLIVDKLVAVDNVAATSVDELSTAMQYSAAVAHSTGVSFEQLVSYIATVSETTRQNAESIGQGMKTMLTRMQDIKAGKIDEDGLGINNVEIALDKAGVKLRESKDSFRDFGAVLEELAGKWDTLTETERAFVAKSIAGIRQVNMFTVLMTNMGRAMELQEVQMASAGLAAGRYRIYMESLEAKLAQFKATLQGLYQEAISSGFIASIVDWGTAMLEAIENAGGLEAVLKKLVPTVIALSSAFSLMRNAGNIAKFINFFTVKDIAVMKNGFAVLKEGFSVAVNSKGVTQYRDATGILRSATEAMVPPVTGAKAAITSLGTSIATTASTIAPYLLAAGALIAIGYAIERSIVTQAEKWRILEQAQKDATQATTDLASARALQKRYTDLNKVIGESTTSVEERKRAEDELIEVQNSLADMMPNILVQWDLEGNAIGVTTEAIEAQIKAYEDLAIAKGQASKGAAEDFLFKETPKSAWATFFAGITDAQLRNAEIESGGMIPYIPQKAPDKDLVANTSDLEDKFNAWRDATLRGDTLAVISDLKVAYQETLMKYQTAMADYGAYGAQAFIDTLREGLEPTIKDALERTASELKEAEDKLALKRRDQFLIQKTKDDKRATLEKTLSGPKLDNAVNYGTGNALNESLYSEILPQQTEILKVFGEALDDVASKKIVSDESIDKLGAYNISFDKLTQTFTYFDGTTKTVVGDMNQMYASLISYMANNFEMDTSNWKLYDSFMQVALAVTKAEETEKSAEEQAKALADANERITNSANTLAEAFQEQDSDGKLSAQTMYELAAAGIDLADDTNTLTEATYNNMIAQLQAQYVKSIGVTSNIDLKASIDSVNAGLWANAAANLYDASTADINIDAQMGLLNTMQALSQAFASLGQGAGSAGSSGAKQEDPRIKENEEIIEQLEEQIELEEDKIDGIKKEIDVIKEAQDQYNDWIDQKKKSLELNKEESDYYKEQQKSLKDLARVKKDIAVLELDNSEEAKAKRLALEEQASEMEGDIAENAEERRYDLQMQALDNLKDAFDRITEEQIKAKEEIIDSIELVIDGLRDQIDATRDIIEELRSQKSSGSSSTYNAYPGGYGSDPSIKNMITKGVEEHGIDDTVNLGQEESWGWMTKADPYITQGNHLGGGIDTRVVQDGKTQELIAMKSGKVLYAGPAGGWGNTIAVQTPDGKIYVLSHNESFTVKPGDMVTKGQTIGMTGNTGNGTGPHSHAQIWEEQLDGAYEQISASMELFGREVGEGSVQLDTSNKNLATIVKANTEKAKAMYEDIKTHKKNTRDLKDASDAEMGARAEMQSELEARLLEEKETREKFFAKIKEDEGTSGSGIYYYPPSNPEEPLEPLYVPRLLLPETKGPNPSNPTGSASANISGALPERDDPYPVGEYTFGDKFNNFFANAKEKITEFEGAIVEKFNEAFGSKEEMQEQAYPPGEAGVDIAAFADKAIEDAGEFFHDIYTVQGDIDTKKAEASIALGDDINTFASKSIDKAGEFFNNIYTVQGEIDVKRAQASISLGDDINTFADKAIDRAREFFEAIFSPPEIGEQPYTPASYQPKVIKQGVGSGKGMVAMAKHSGGLIESHHDGNFVGNLASNEVFAKLLKGEYVATEGQMDNFMKNILPKVSMNMPKTYPAGGAPSINVSMPITVEGNMDKSVIPDIKQVANQVIGEINKSLVARGYVRPANMTVS